MASSSSSSVATAATASQLQYTNVILHHVPNEQAPALLAAMMTYAFCLGIITLELAGNMGYDYRCVIRRAGWREPVKASNRVAYLVCRYSAWAFLFASILNLTLPGRDCYSFAKAALAMWALPLFFVDLIFVQRTLALYSWDKRVVLPLGTLYVAYVGFCLYGVLEFGTGLRIPGSDFCGFKTNNTGEEPHASLYIVYNVLTIALDTIVLLLTAHRLIDGGLANVINLMITKTTALRKDRAERKAAGQEVGEISLPNLIMRQGVGYFMVLEASRLAFLVVYYTQSNSASYQILVAGLMATVGPLLAGLLFRQTAEAVNRTANATKHSQMMSNASSGAGDGNNALCGVAQTVSVSIPISSPLAGRRSEMIDMQMASNALLYSSRNVQSKQSSSVDDDSVSVAAAYFQDSPTSGHDDLKDADIEAAAASARLPIAHLVRGSGPQPLNIVGVDEEENVLPLHQQYMHGALLTAPPHALSSYHAQPASQSVESQMSGGNIPRS